MKRLLKSVLVCAAIVTVAASCSTQSPGGQQSSLAPATGVVDIKIIAFNDLHGNLKTPNLRVPVPDASQSTGFRLEPAGGVEQFFGAGENTARKESQSHRGVRR